MLMRWHGLTVIEIIIIHTIFELLELILADVSRPTSEELLDIVMDTVFTLVGVWIVNKIKLIEINGSSS